MTTQILYLYNMFGVNKLYRMPSLYKAMSDTNKDCDVNETTKC